MATPPSGSNYLVSRIKEALYNSGGNKTKAMQQVMAWSAQDMQLLQALTRAHLSGIVAYHVDRVASGGAKSSGGAASKPTAQPQARPRAASPQQKMVNPAQGSPFGQAILKAASSTNASVFGLESYEAPRREDKTSPRHVEAMKHIASFSQAPQGKRR